MGGEGGSELEAHKLKVHRESFEIAVAPAGGSIGEAFAMIEYGGERTVVRPLSGGEQAFGGRKFKMITFKMSIPLDAVGFLAPLAQALAAKGVPVFFLSSYRTDHLLVPEDRLSSALEALGSEGFSAESDPPEPPGDGLATCESLVG